MVETSGLQKESPSLLLSKVGLFAGLKDKVGAFAGLAEIMQIKDFSLGHKLTVEGQMGDELFILINGQVSITKNTPEGDSYKVVILNSSITPALGEGGLIEAEPRSATITCDTNCKCLVLTRESFLLFTEKNPEWAVPILQKIALTLMIRLRQTSGDLMLLHKALMDEIRG